MLFRSEDYRAGLNEITRLRPVSYRYNGKGGMRETGQIHYGFVAQEAQPVMPEMIAVRPARLEPMDQADTDLLMVDTTPLIFALTNAVTELSHRVEAVEARTGRTTR